MVRCMLIAMKVPKKFWGEASKHAVYVQNRSPTKPVASKTPLSNQHKLDECNRPMVYFLTELGSKAYRMYDSTKNMREEIGEIF